jgi:DNA-binding transcriptional MocR family regulator
VNNPSTIILSDSRRKAIVEIAKNLSLKANRLIPVIFDKAYEDIIHNTKIKSPVSGLKFDELNQVFEIGTLSKLFAPALRIGYIILPDNNFAEIISQRTSDIGFSSSLINQEIASWLLDNYVTIQKDNVNRGYREKADFIKQLLTTYLDDYIETYSGGNAAFYFYITFKKIRTDSGSEFFRFLSRTTGNSKVDGKDEKNPRLIYIPGTICSKSEKAIRQLRISYGFEDPDVFERAIKLMAEACKYAGSQ